MDLSNNFLKDVDMVLVSLTTLPNLKVLNYPVKKEKEGLIMERLKSLTLLNNVKVLR